MVAVIGLARRTDPATSKAAAEKAGDAVHNELRRVLIALVGAGRGNSRQIAAGDHAFRFIIAKRLSKLEEMGLAERVQTERDADTGRFAEVWRATSAGVEAIQR